MLLRGTNLHAHLAHAPSLLPSFPPRRAEQMALALAGFGDCTGLETGTIAMNLQAG